MQKCRKRSEHPDKKWKFWNLKAMESFGRIHKIGQGKTPLECEDIKLSKAYVITMPGAAGHLNWTVVTKQVAKQRNRWGEK